MAQKQSIHTISTPITQCKVVPHQTNEWRSEGEGEVDDGVRKRKEGRVLELPHKVITAETQISKTKVQERRGGELWPRDQWTFGGMFYTFTISLPYRAESPISGPSKIFLGLYLDTKDISSALSLLKNSQKTLVMALLSFCSTDDNVSLLFLICHLFDVFCIFSF